MDAPPAASSQVKDMLAKLVGFDTTSRNSNLQLIDFVEDYLAGFGIASRRVFSDEKDKANLFATIGPADAAGGVVLSGHTDVVPVDGQDWRTDPFDLAEAGGRLWGRGTCDMKGFIAVALALVPEFRALDLKRPIHLAFSYDEEVGCLGAPRLIEAMTASLPPCHAVIVGEPTDMKAVGAHRGIAAYETVITGRPAHSSQPQEGANAIEAAARLVGYLTARQAEMRDNPSPIETEFSPPFATVNVGMIEGGTATNIIAERCSFRWGVRSATGGAGEELRAGLDDFAAGEILPAMRAVAPEADVQTSFVAGTPPLEMDAASAAAELVRTLTGQNELGSVAFAAEAGLFAEAGVPAVIMGPGSILQAHKADEFVELSQLDECAGFLRKLADWCAG